MALPNSVSNSSETVITSGTIKGKRTSNELFNTKSIISSLSPSLYFKSIIVLAEGWPSWVYSIGGLFKGAKLFVACQSSLIKNKEATSALFWS